jgi:hypothetical protein
MKMGLSCPQKCTHLTGYSSSSEEEEEEEEEEEAEEEEEEEEAEGCWGAARGSGSACRPS